MFGITKTFLISLLDNFFVDFRNVEAVRCRDSVFIKRSKNIFEIILYITQKWGTVRYVNKHFVYILKFKICKL